MKWKTEYCTHINDFTHVDCFEGEEWKDIYYTDMRTGEIVDYRGIYQVSNLGRIRSLNRTSNNKKLKGRILKVDEDRKGYCIIHPCKNGKNKTLQIHRLVLLCFNPTHEVKCVNHLDENIKNNNLENLQWTTIKENTNYGTGNLRNVERHIKHCVMGIKDDDIIIFNSLADASRSGFDNRTILRCIQKKENYHTHKGYKWFSVYTCPLPPSKKLYEKEVDING